MMVWTHVYNGWMQGMQGRLRGMCKAPAPLHAGECLAGVVLASLLPLEGHQPSYTR